MIGGGEVAARGQRVGVVATLGSLPAGQGLLVVRQRLLDSPRRVIGVGEVAARGQRVRMVAAQDAFAAGEGPLVLGDGVLDPA
jgi:hypothetical protein